MESSELIMMTYIDEKDVLHYASDSSNEEKSVDDSGNEEKDLADYGGEETKKTS